MVRQPAAESGPERPPNNVLRLLRRDDYALLSPHLENVRSSGNDLLYNPGDNVEWVYFPCASSLVAYLVPNEDGRDVEIALVGREGAVGGIVSHGHLPAYCRITVKSAGPLVRLRVSELEAAKLKSLPLRNLFARYADCLLAQIFQSTACNAIHSIEQRAAKWILAAMDRTGNHRVPMTHEELAVMLGVGRSYTSRILQTFKAQGILETGRGALLVRSFDTLNTRACRCNEAVRSHFEIVLRGVYPPEAGTPSRAESEAQRLQAVRSGLG